MTDRTIVPLSSVPQYEIKEINVRESVFVLLKHKTLILALFIAALAIGAFYTFLQTPEYRTISRINIDTSTYNVLPEVVSQKNDLDLFLQTQLELLVSRTVASRVSQKLGLTPWDLAPANEKKELMDKWSSRPVEEREKAVQDKLLTMVTVNGVKKTTLFDITLLAPEAELSRNLANTWAEQYVEYSLSAQYDYSRKAEEMLTGQIQRLQKEVAEKQQILLKYSSQEQVILLDNAGSSINIRKLGDLNSSLSQATSQKIAKSVAYRELEKHGKFAIPEVRNSSVIQRLKQEYAMLETEYAKKSSLYLADFPIMQSLRDQMDQIQKGIDAEATDLFNKVLANAKADFDDAVKNEAALKSEVDRVKAETITGSQEEFNYERLRAELNEKRKSLDILLQKQTDARASSQAKQMKATTITIVEPGQLPFRPYKPDILRNLMIAAFAGLGLGIGFAFLTGYLDRSFKHAEDVERHAQLPLLGMIPKCVPSNGNNGKALIRRVNEIELRGENFDLTTLNNPDSLESEAFRTIRASLLVSFPEGPPQTILVTSSQAGEGKTFVACNLAVSLAQLGRNVVLVDADMRNPRIHRIMKVSNNDTGLSTFLTSNLRVTEVVRPGQFEGMSVITSGSKTPRPAELLASRRFDDFLAQLQTEFDHVIIDSPPVIPVSDALILASKTNCVLFVIRAGETSREIVQIAKQKLIHFDATIVGTVLNGIDLSDPFYQFGYYSAYGKYYSQESSPNN